MQLLETLRQQENDYLSLFARPELQGRLLFFCNDEIRTMYDHNFTLVGETNSAKALMDAVVALRTAMNEQKKTFLKIVFHPQIQLSQELIAWGEQEGFRSRTLLYMKAKPALQAQQKRTAACNVQRAESYAAIQDGLRCATNYSRTHRDQELCQKKISQREKLYLDKSIAYYVAYEQGQPVGTCDYFWRNGIVKLEEFTVLEERQGQGIGTAMLQKMLSDAHAQGASHVYLTTDQDDRAKNLYSRFAFEVVGRETSWLYVSSED